MSSPEEIAVKEDVVRALLAAQHPDLADLELTELHPGYDNNLWRLGTSLLARLPRRAIAAPLVLIEHRWLRDLAPRLPLPVPTPVRMGQPSADYPWPWSIVPWLEGVSSDRAPIDKPVQSAQRLGSFLRAMHQPAPAEAPHNPYRSVPLSERGHAFDQRIEELNGVVDVDSACAVWERALAASPWTGPPVWLHADLHPANVLVQDGILSAVVDFGDMCAGDPATDVAAAWMLFPNAARPAFVTAYGAVDADLEARALGWATIFGLMLVGIGLDGRPTYEKAGRSTLDRVNESVASA